MGCFIRHESVWSAFSAGFDVFAFAANTGRFIQSLDLDGASLTPEDVASVPVPALVLAGAYDYSVPVSVSQATHDAFAADRPPGSMVILADAGHWPMWDESGPFTAVVINFIDKVE